MKTMCNVTISLQQIIIPSVKLYLSHIPTKEPNDMSSYNFSISQEEGLILEKEVAKEVVETLEIHGIRAAYNFIGRM